MKKSRAELWADKGLTATDRVSHPPAIQRDSISQSTLDRKIERGDISQKLRLRYYPSIEIKFDNMYAGSFKGSLDELEEKLFAAGYRNNPTAYVEISDEYGPDDGSYARQRITESQEFPYLGRGRPFGVVTWWNRVKEQVHVTAFVEEDSDWIHLLAHMESSAWLQPVRHVTVSEGNAEIGVREFREAWRDEHGEALVQRL
jgi:hypothetical protein